MSLKFKLKKCIMKWQINKRIKTNPFDLNYAETYMIPEDADSSHNNSYYFSMHDPKTKESMFWRYARRGGDAKDEVWFVFRDAGGQVYFSENDHFDKGTKVPVSINVAEPGKKLTFTFSGWCYQADFNGGDCKPGKKPKVKVEMQAEFHGLSQVFDFSRHLPADTMAVALAKEKWTKEFIAAIKENHQVHTEQQGTISATIKVDSETHRFSRINAFRDHSYGKRDWGYFDRHIWILGLMENGDMFHTSFVRYPAVTQINAGLYLKDGKPDGYVKNLPSMDSLPILGKCPPKASYEVELDNGRKFTIKFKREFEVKFDFQKQYTISEGVSEFEIDGLRGRGITEFGFNPDKTRWTKGA
ncbi:MAG: hypothetical protein FWE53_04145 [Firmicutes bacterium]|nr:hypothetical protein [Bacillota bacterium]